MTQAIEHLTEQPKRSVAIILCLLLVAVASLLMIHWIFTHIYLFYDSVIHQHQSYVLIGLSR
jgi:hypothetical protein